MSDNQFTNEEIQVCKEIAIDANAEAVKLSSHQFDGFSEIIEKLEEQIYLSFGLPSSVFNECKYDNRTSGQNEEITWAKIVNEIDQKLS